MLPISFDLLDLADLGGVIKLVVVVVIILVIVAQREEKRGSDRGSISARGGGRRGVATSEL